MAKKETSAVETTGSKDVAIYKGFEDDSGLGNEEVTTSEMTIPFLAILQGLSPQQQSRHEQYVEGAEAGMLINSVSNDLYDGEKGVIVVNCYMQPRFIEWVPRDKGGGFVASYIPGEEPQTLMGDDNKPTNQLPNGHDLNKTHYHMCLILKPDEGIAEEVVVAMTRTQLKYSSKWNTRFHTMRWDGTRGKFRPPRFGMKWKLSTFLDKNDKGEFFSWQIQPADRIDPENEFDVMVYSQAKRYALTLKRGVEITPPASQESGDSGGAAPDSAGGEPPKDGPIPF